MARTIGSGISGRTTHARADLRIPLPSRRRFESETHRRISRTLHRGKSLSGDDRQQPLLRYRPLSLRTGHLRRNRTGLPELDAISPHHAISGRAYPRPNAGNRIGTSAGFVPFASRRAEGYHHQFDDGGHVRQSARLACRGSNGCCQLRTDDCRRICISVRKASCTVHSIRC